MDENTDRPPLELDLHWTNLHTLAFTQLPVTRRDPCS